MNKARKKVVDLMKRIKQEDGSNSSQIKGGHQNEEEEVEMVDLNFLVDNKTPLSKVLSELFDEEDLPDILRKLKYQNIKTVGMLLPQFTRFSVEQGIEKLKTYGISENICWGIYENFVKPQLKFREEAEELRQRLLREEEEKRQRLLREEEEKRQRLLREEEEKRLETDKMEKGRLYISENMPTEWPQLWEVALETRKYDRVMEFVKTEMYEQLLDRVTTLTKYTPTIQARNLAIPAVLGFMGVGKTRMCEEVAEAVAQEVEPNRILVIYVNSANFWDELIKSDLWVDGDRTAAVIEKRNLLALALMFSQISRHSFEFKKNGHYLKLEDVLVPINNIGYSRIILILDEIQIDSALVGALLEGCVLSMTERICNIVIIPILAGIVNANQTAIPSGFTVAEFRLEPLEHTEVVIEKFAAGIGMDLALIYENRFNHLLYLYELCQGRPNLLFFLINKLNELFASKATFRQDMVVRGLTSNEASSVFKKIRGAVVSTYGAVRWHGLLYNPKIKKQDDIKHFPSFDIVTKPIITRLILDVVLARDVGVKDVIVPNLKPPPRKKLNIDPSLLEPAEIILPTYNSCIENGVLYLTQKKKKRITSFKHLGENAGLVQVNIPLYGLITMVDIVELQPPDMDMFNPYNVSWQQFEMTAIFSLWLQLVSLEFLFETEMQTEEFVDISQLRSGSMWNGCTDIKIQIPQHHPTIDFLGGSIKPSKETDKMEIEQGVYDITLGSLGGAGNVVFEPNQCYLTKANEPGWDGFIILNGKRGSEDVYILIASQSKFREQNVNNGVSSDAKINNGSVRTIINGMKGTETYFKKLATKLVDKPIVTVYDIFSARFSPQDLTNNLPLEELFCITRGEDLEGSIGPTLTLLNHRPAPSSL